MEVDIVEQRFHLLLLLAVLTHTSWLRCSTDLADFLHVGLKCEWDETLFLFFLNLNFYGN